jgi:hypothetical protein
VTLPAVEVKLSSVVKTPSQTTVTAVIYRVADGGLSPTGEPIYARTLWRAFTRTFDAGWDADRFGAQIRQRLIDEAAARGVALTEDRIVCDIG